MSKRGISAVRIAEAKVADYVKLIVNFNKDRNEELRKSIIILENEKKQLLSTVDSEKDLTEEQTYRYDILNGQIKLLEEQGWTINELALKTAVLSQNWEKVLKLTKGVGIAEKDLPMVQGMVNDRLKERLNVLGQIRSAIEKELKVATSLYMQYQKADEIERGRIRRMMELRLLPAEDLARAYRGDIEAERGA